MWQHVNKTITIKRWLPASMKVPSLIGTPSSQQQQSLFCTHSCSKINYDNENIKSKKLEYWLPGITMGASRARQDTLESETPLAGLRTPTSHAPCQRDLHLELQSTPALRIPA